MTELIVRKLEIDLASGFARHWHGGDAFRSHYYNALSMSFPVGEQYFIDAVRLGVQALPAGAVHTKLQQRARGFIGQEATHRHIHAQYNAHLEQQGLVNHWARWAGWRIKHSQWMSAKNHLAVTCAYEHCTAVFADGTLRYASWFDAAEPKMRTLWRWHAAEETEHRSVAFDLYTALGGGWLRRVAWYAYLCMMFTAESGLQTALNLRRDGTLFKPGTWASAIRFFWGRDGAMLRSAVPLLAYFNPRFHPDFERRTETAVGLAARWLADNASQFSRSAHAANPAAAVISAP